MVCNIGMDDDRTLILNYGGPAKLARMLGYGRWGTNRVSNWMTRGIPAHVKVAHPEIFLAGAPLAPTQEPTTPEPQPAEAGNV